MMKGQRRYAWLVIYSLFIWLHFGTAIYPTPIVGMLGLLPDVSQHCTPGFKAEGDVVYLLGAGLDAAADAEALAGSEYLALFHKTVAGQPHLDLDLEQRLQKLTLGLIRSGQVRSSSRDSAGRLASASAVERVSGQPCASKAGRSATSATRIAS